MVLQRVCVINLTFSWPLLQFCSLSSLSMAQIIVVIPVKAGFERSILWFNVTPCLVCLKVIQGVRFVAQPLTP